MSTPPNKPDSIKVVLSTTGPVSKCELKAREGGNLELDEGGVGFAPTQEMKRIKAEFMASCVGLTVQEIRSLSVNEITGKVGKYGKKLPILLGNPEFKEWLTNPSEMDVRVNYLLMRSLDNLEEIIDGTTELYSVKDKLSAQKQLLEIYETVKRINGESGSKLDIKPKIDPKEIARQLFEKEKADKEREREKEKELPRAPKIPFPGKTY